MTNTTLIPRVAILLADGFEDAEAVICIDLLRRLDIHVDVLSCMDSLALDTYFLTRISADYLLADKEAELYDAVLMVGGPKGTDNLGTNAKVLQFIERHISENKWICALCSAPAKVLSKNGLLGGRPYSTGDNLINAFPDGEYVDEKVVVVDNFITGKGLGVAFEFIFTVAQHLLPNNVAKVTHQASHIYFDHWSA